MLYALFKDLKKINILVYLEVTLQSENLLSPKSKYLEK
jgi:hypothetical protein